MKTHLIIILLALLPLSLGAQVNESRLDSLERLLDLSEVVVTGTRTPKFLKDTPVLTRVITAKDIQRTDATDIQDLLQQELPGIEFTYAMNQQTHLNFSGFGGQGILFLVDGERLAGETMDDVDFSRLTLDNVERIEIVKGASSALYGSNANGGVINIITRKPDRNWSLNLNGRYGKHNQQRYGAALGLNIRQWSNTLNATYNTQDNYDVHSQPGAVTRVISTIYGDRTLNLRDQLTWRPTQHLSITGRIGYFFRQVQRTPDIPERYRDFTGGLRLNWDIATHDKFEASYAFDQYDKSDLQRLAGIEVRDYSNVQNTLRALYHHHFLRGDILTIGADYMRDYLFNTNLCGEKRIQHSFDLFAQYDWQINSHWELLGALRYDWLSDTRDSHLTPKVNVRYKPLRNLSLRGGYGMGFRAPTLKEKYYNFDMSGIWIVEGNPDLVPEVSHNINLSAEYTLKNYNFIASTYYNIVTDKIATSAPYFKTPTDKLPYLPYANLSRMNIYGAELGAQARWSLRPSTTLAARMTYAYTHEQFPTDNDGQSINNQYIPARPHSLNAALSLDHTFTRNYAIALSLSGRVLSGTQNQEYRNYYDVSQGTVTVSYPAYTIWKLALTQTIRNGLRLTAAVDNLFNYRPSHYYLNAPLTDGAWYQIGMSIDIDKLVSKIGNARHHIIQYGYSHPHPSNTQNQVFAYPNQSSTPPTTAHQMLSFAYC